MAVLTMEAVEKVDNDRVLAVMLMVEVEVYRYC